MPNAKMFIHMTVVRPLYDSYLHGSRSSCQNVYIHGCLASSIKYLFTGQPFVMPKGLYMRLMCIQYKIVIYTAAVNHTKRFLYTAAEHSVNSRFSNASRFSCKAKYIHDCRESSKKLFTRQPLRMTKPREQISIC